MCFQGMGYDDGDGGPLVDDCDCLRLHPDQYKVDYCADYSLYCYLHLIHFLTCHEC